MYWNYRLLQGIRLREMAKWCGYELTVPSKYVASGLSVPTAMTFGPDGNLYVSNFGAAPPGAGQIVKIRIW